MDENEKIDQDIMNKFFDLWMGLLEEQHRVPSGNGEEVRLYKSLLRTGFEFGWTGRALWDKEAGYPLLQPEKHYRK